MGRRIDRHVRRRVTSLDGLWDFAWLGDIDPDTVDIESIDFVAAMAVPGCWDALPDYSGRRGLAAYARDLPPQHDTARQAVFDGVQHWSAVYCDGQRIAEHRWGFTRFAVDIPSAANRMVVLVDNRDDPTRAPLHRDFYDWHHYGGIARSVALHHLRDVSIAGVRVETVALEPPTIEITARLEFRAGPSAVDARIVVDGVMYVEEPVEHESVRWRVELPGARLWSPEEPALHLVDVVVGNDDWRERIGLRMVGTQAGRLTINGKPLRLLGVNRHDMHPDHGSGLPDDHRLADLQLIRELGANFLRGGHYPQDEGLLDLCDEMGICVWNEAIAWQADARQLTNHAWLDDCEAHIEEMIALARNHPSVILWGLLNESASHDAACRPGYERLIGAIRAADPMRPVTYAGNHTENDVCADLVDVVSINAYPGWYYGSLEDVVPELDRLVAAVDDAGFRGKPVIVSEIGAEAIPGWHDRSVDRWSEEHQAVLLERVIHHLFVERDRVTGLAIWVFADFLTPQAMPKILIRPRAYNHKGLVDEYRRPKKAADTVREAFEAVDRQ